MLPRFWKYQLHRITLFSVAEPLPTRTCWFFRLIAVAPCRECRFARGRTTQCGGLAIKSVSMENPRLRAADCSRSACPPGIRKASSFGFFCRDCHACGMDRASLSFDVVCARVVSAGSFTNRVRSRAGSHSFPFLAAATWMLNAAAIWAAGALVMWLIWGLWFGAYGKSKAETPNAWTRDDAPRGG